MSERFLACRFFMTLEKSTYLYLHLSSDCRRLYRLVASGVRGVRAFKSLIFVVNEGYFSPFQRRRRVGKSFIELTFKGKRC